MPPMLRSSSLLLLLASLGACSSLKVTLLDTSVQKPSNVALYFTVETSDGEPVGGIPAEEFKIYEDGKPVSVHESKQIILNPEVAVVHYTMLLVDMSGSVTESGQLEAVSQAADTFTQKVAKVHQVGVYSFDGSKQITKVSGFSSSPGAVQGTLAGLTKRKGRDPSTNLNGAIMEALKELKKTRDAAPVPLRFASLVVFTDGTDRAGYATTDQVREALDQSDIEVFTIGLGGEIDKGELETIGRNGTALAEDPAKLQKAFDDVAGRIENMAKRYYLLSYCSPSRAGKHVLAVEAARDGKSGRAEHEFDASGFAAPCDPNKKPAFQVGGRGVRRTTTSKKKG